MKAIGIALGAVAMALAVAIPAQADPEPSPPPAPASTIDKDGTYKVGVDILPGTYTSGGPAEDSACYWKRVGADGKLLDNALTKKSASVRIEPTDASFTTTECSTWQLSACGTACPPPPPGPGPLEMLGQLGGLLGPGRATGPMP
ncbi:hypothetical protein [Mycolicibacterium baixiangningiae]|uniref:hypothetical protein n=1 Tax=Mycolicibacterium baixiangningiae TaxID=2761578 RepID=UPI0018D1B782|nr:hypothetical protein [Mycolicibacterium baixiangningiae]